MPTSKPNPKPNRTDIIKSAGTLIEPITSNFGPVMAAIPELLLPSPTGKAGKPIAPKSSKFHRTIALIVLIILALLIIGGGTYWWIHRTPSTNKSTVPPQIQTQHIDYRNSTFPEGTLTLGNNKVDLQITNLTHAPNGQSYKLVLETINGQDPSVPDLTNSGLEDLGNFDIDADGNVTFGDGKTAFTQPTITTTDEAVVLVGSGKDYSIILAGRLTTPDTSGRTATLTFPGQFVDAQGSLIIKTVPSEKTSDLTIHMDSLPNVAPIGYKYEARLVKLVGPAVAKTLVMGRFAGNTGDSPTEISFTGIAIGDYTDLVISLEPTWDTDKSLSPVRPYSAPLQ